MRGYVGRRFVVVGMPGSTGSAEPATASRRYDFDVTAEEIETEDPQLTKLGG